MEEIKSLTAKQRKKIASDIKKLEKELRKEISKDVVNFQIYKNLTEAIDFLRFRLEENI